MKCNLFSKKENRPEPKLRSVFKKGSSGLLLDVSDVLRLGRIKGQVADRRYQTVDAERNHRKEDIRQRSGLKACGLQGRMIDNETTDPSKEESQQKTYKIVVFHHFCAPFLYTLNKVYHIIVQKSTVFSKRIHISAKKSIKAFFLHKILAITPKDFFLSTLGTTPVWF